MSKQIFNNYDDLENGFLITKITDKGAIGLRTKEGYPEVYEIAHMARTTTRGSDEIGYFIQTTKEITEIEFKLISSLATQSL